MEGEINNLILVWTIVVASLCYCHTVSKILSDSTMSRRLAILPIVCLFFVLPLNFTSGHFRSITSFVISWLASFKLILFAFNKGSLFANPPIPLSRFILLACFPIKPVVRNDDQDKKANKSPLSYVMVTKIAMLTILTSVYYYKEQMHPKIFLCICLLHICLFLDIYMTLLAALAKALIQVELEPQFKEPYLTTSVQNFWGKRWNLTVSDILRHTVYNPVRSISAPYVGKEWVSIPGVLASFFVSGLMHELIIYNLGRLRPTGEIMSFFMIQGVSVSAEIVVKKIARRRKFSVPGIVSGPLTLAYVIFTAVWIYLPPIMRTKVDVKACTEILAFVEFVKNRRLVSPNELSCPFF